MLFRSRLMLYVKRAISRVASTTLFDPDTPATWNLFIAAAIPILDEIKGRFGLDAYKVVLDETTTTPDLVDQNILYAKIFLKPTKAIEFIAIDFVITNSGAAFTD